MLLRRFQLAGHPPFRGSAPPSYRPSSARTTSCTLEKPGRTVTV